MSKITQNELNQLKKQVTEIMKVNGETHNEWLYNQYQKYLSENTEVVMEALRYYSESKNNTVKKKNDIENVEKKEINTDKKLRTQ